MFHPDEYDLVIVGTGFCGSVIANLAAADGKKVLMLEKRSHIAGNMYDYVDEDGLLVQKYGPHVFHTNNEDVAQYLLGLDEWRDFEFTYAVEIDGKMLRAPFGFVTIDRFFEPDEAQDLKDRLLRSYPDQDGVMILDLMESEDLLIARFGQLLYEKNYLPYALKQWQLPPEELSAEIIGRMPVRLSDNEPYFQDAYQMLPRDGFTALFEKMLDSPNIDVHVGVDALDHLSLDEGSQAILLDGAPLEIPLVYTGPLENLLLGRSGVLPYRSLRIDFERYDEPSFHECASVTYPATHDYLRSTDYGKFNEGGHEKGTTVTFEYPTSYDVDSEYGSEPYYPILTEDSERANRELRAEAARYPMLVPCGRLADFRYYNMDKAIERAFEVYDALKDAYWCR